MKLRKQVFAGILALGLALSACGGNATVPAGTIATVQKPLAETAPTGAAPAETALRETVPAETAAAPEAVPAETPVVCYQGELYTYRCPYGVLDYTQWQELGTLVYTEATLGDNLETNAPEYTGWNAALCTGGMRGDAIVAWAPTELRGSDSQAYDLLFVPDSWNQGLDEFVFQENDGGGVSLVKYCGNEANVVIPSAYEGKPVTAVGTGGGEGPFSNCPEVVSVTIPEGVTTVWDNSFYGCLRLESVTFPSSLTGIGHCAFNLCPALKELHFQGNAPDYGNYIFDPDRIGQIELHCPADSTGWDAALWKRMVQIPE